jgi:hypothetical protein
VDRPPAAVDTADRPAAVAMVDRLVADRPVVVATVDRPVADLRVATADLPAVDLRPVVMADLLPAEHLRDTAGLLVMAVLRAHRPACISLLASAARWAPAATCLR